MSQQSNPATFREALSEARKVIVVACGDKAPYVKVALARIDEALAASGTEAAPRGPIPIMDPTKLAREDQRGTETK